MSDLREPMNANDISNAKDPDLRASLGALRRAAQQARKTAIQTGTDLVIVKDGQMRRISPEELRQQAEAETSAQEKSQA
jgi:hypothetical protein